ncbi:PP2C family serine/threonine-protein phosphatase [Actinocrispum sp. NPDC049592]|uniref:PP2C family protein-serine/threonine phosphatase n=1 Tax=Actinocrispum sp. NPDC049592 TaxID=3154835 RepID=UPI0034402160
MIECATLSCAGSLHPDNQDRLLADPERGVFLVVDGMGGLADAAATAGIVVSQLSAAMNAVDVHGPDVRQVVTGVLDKVNAAVRAAARTGPGTTGAAVAMVVVRDGRALAVHLGDSRIYLARNGKVTRLTEDHTEDGHLTRFLGMGGEVSPDVSLHDLRPGDRILLCTDGLTGTVEDRAIGAMLTRAGDLNRVCRQLVDAATEGGTIDDTSVVVVCP